MDQFEERTLNKCQDDWLIIWLKILLGSFLKTLIFLNWRVISLLLCKEIQPVHPKGNQSWIFIGRTDVEAEAPILWPHDVKNWLIWKDPDAGKV